MFEFSSGVFHSIVRKEKKREEPPFHPQPPRKLIPNMDEFNFGT